MTPEKTMGGLARIKDYLVGTAIEKESAEVIKSAVGFCDKNIAQPVFINKYFRAYECPKCHKRREYKEMLYCGLCGQRLNWDNAPENIDDVLDDKEKKEANRIFELLHKGE